jgi:hypothetical protein
MVFLLEAKSCRNSAIEDPERKVTSGLEINTPPDDALPLAMRAECEESTVIEE